MRHRQIMYLKPISSHDLSAYLIAWFILQTIAKSDQSRSGTTRNEISIDSERPNSSSQFVKFANKSSHESTSPTSIGSLFMNAADNSQVQHYHQQGPPPLIGYGQQAIALGAEDQQHDQGIGPNILVAEANNPNEMIMGQPEPNVYGTNQPMAMMPSNLQAADRQQDNVLASIYIDQFGNQQLRLPQGARVAQADGLESQENADSMSSGFYSSQPQHYGLPMQPLQQSATLYTNQAFPSQQQSPNIQQGQFSPNVYAQSTIREFPRRLRKTKQKPLTDQVRGVPKFSKELTLKPTRTNESLSNAQLMSLIDELKDFNSKQATNVKQEDSSSPAGNHHEGHHREEDTQNDDDEIDDDPSTVDTRHSSASEPPPEKTNKRKVEKGQEKRQSHESKVSPDDMAKFAKFLMTKEGANMRFQLGLDKDSPDDGDLDEDDKDPLMESKKRASKTAGPSSKGNKNTGRREPSSNESTHQDLNELDKKHSEVASQMDALLENLTGTLNKAARENELKKRRRERKDGGNMDIDSDDLRARARRNSGDNKKRPVVVEVERRPEARRTIINENSSSASRPSVPPKIKHEKGHDNNLAKQLIQQEMMHDKLESTIQSIRKVEDERPVELSPSSRIHGTASLDEKHEKKRRGIDRVELIGGQEEENYPKKARRRDHIELIQDLQKARRDRSRSRSGPSMALTKEPILRQALNGELGMQTESHPDGKLILKSGRGPSMTVKLPQKSNRVVHADHEHDAANEGGDDDNKSIALGNQSNHNSMKDNDVKLNHVKIESDKPLKDEYPISEKVSSRLNVLSSNLDRYFNDGFMNEIENRAKIKGNSGRKPRGGGDEHQQADSSNVNETSTKDGGGGGGENTRNGDRDFDVNVGVDGKRDSPEKDDDDYYEGDEGDEQQQTSSSKAANDQEKSPERQARTTKNKPYDNKSRKRKTSAGKKDKLSSKRKIGASGGQTIPKSHRQELADDVDGGEEKLKQRHSAGENHISFESRGGKPDPVEGESFDSPIGPDSDNLELLMPPATADKKVESSHESKQVMTRNGKRVTPKFYEEPDW